MPKYIWFFALSPFAYAIINGVKAYYVFGFLIHIVK